MNTIFYEETTNQILKSIDIPPQPQILRIVMAEQQKNYPDLKKIADAVVKDVGLSAAMLRAANSPAFALRQKVTSISKAVMLLGMNNAISLITGLSLRMVMSGKGKIRLERFWDTASDTAIICSILAKRFNVLVADQAYILGLFHDCGIPLLIQRFDNYIDILKKGNANTEEQITVIEDRELKTNHSVVGYIIARSWFLSEEIREIILHHHNEALFVNHKNNNDDVLVKQVGLLILSEYLCHLYHRESKDLIWQRVGKQIMECFELTENCVSDLSEDMNDILSSI
ncbi:putative Predicted signal transduction protein [Gammaproteobacteria bacterium]